jgi:asparagine synthase (glutamine-hydrolysing)
MCGIVGYYNGNSSPEDINALVDKMSKFQEHRGLDGSGKYISSQKNFGLKICRLSILDLELGIQPMHSTDQRYVIIFNGTILNSPELRCQLENESVKFFTKNSDTEVLLNVLIHYGTEGIDYLNGSFAFAFFDKKKKKLICGRDRFGLAPLYYLHKDNKFLFASELKSILKSGHSNKRLNKQILYHYLSLLYCPGPETIIEDINKLQPGHFLELNLMDNDLKIKKWHHIKIEPDNSKNLNEWKESILFALKRSVKRSTLSDVPLACGLSGGLDSQSIVGILSSEKKLNTFSMGFKNYDEGPLNELNSSKIAANYFKTNHKEILINQDDYFKDLDKMVYHLDVPYGGGLPLWYVFKEAGKNFRVFLTGLGGDELFGNYGRWTILEETYFNLTNNYYQFKTLFFDRKYFFKDSLKNKLLMDKNKNFEKTSQYMFNKLNNTSSKNIRDKIFNLDLTNQLPDEFCMMTNKFSLANNIEARAPFLDNELTNLMLTVPCNLRTSKKDFKYLLRKTIKEIIPKENLYNRKKGFVGLESQTINHNFNYIKNELFSKDKIKKDKIFDYEFLVNFLNSYEKYGKYSEKNDIFMKKTYGEKTLWSLIMFQKWHDIFMN